jgi:hypothetical protein
MPEVFAAHAIKADPLSIPQVRGHILKALQETAKDAETILESIVATWNHKVTFTKPIIRYSGGDASITISTHDTIFLYLDGGTLVRTAVMTPGFVPKTVPGGPYKSGKGKGGFSHYGTRRPGIQARLWTVRLAEDMSKVIKREMDLALTLGQT